MRTLQRGSRVGAGYGGHCVVPFRRGGLRQTRPGASSSCRVGLVYKCSPARSERLHQPHPLQVPCAYENPWSQAQDERFWLDCC